MLTPLRYPGGKAKLGAWLAYLLRSNNINGSYVEAYAGGAGAAIYLLTNNYIKNIVINDLDPAIYSFWISVTHDTASFVRKIIDTPVTVEERERQKEIYNNPFRYSELELGFATFFLNRTNRSGIITGGVIGGKNQTGKYKIGARYTKENLVERVKNIGGMRDRITIHCEDALRFLQGLRVDDNSLINLDPPYYNKGSQLYSNFYKHEDHISISNHMHKISTPLIITYDNCDEIKEIYEDHKSLTFNIVYSSHLDRPVAQELLIYKNIRIDPLPFTSKQISPVKIDKALSLQ